MSYRRWAPGNPWYVFQHTSGGLAIWHTTSALDTRPIYTDEEVEAFVDNPDAMELIPGFAVSSDEAQEDLQIAMIEYLRDPLRAEYEKLRRKPTAKFPADPDFSSDGA